MIPINWKTSLAGVLVFVIGGAVYGGYVSDQMGIALIALVSGGGHLVARDATAPETIASKTMEIKVS